MAHRVLDVLTARGTVTPAGTAEQALYSYAFPAHFWRPGKVVRASLSSTVIDQNSTDTVTARVRFGAAALTGTAIATSAAIDAAANDIHVANVEIVCRTIDADGVGTFYARATQNDPDATGTVAVDGYAVAEITAINTTAPTYLGYTAQWSVSSAANDAAADYALVEEIV